MKKMSMKMTLLKMKEFKMISRYRHGNGFFMQIFCCCHGFRNLELGSHYFNVGLNCVKIGAIIKKERRKTVHFSSLALIIPYCL